MEHLLLDEEGMRELSDGLHQEGVFIGKSTRNQLPSVLYQYRGQLIEVVYQVYRSDICYFSILSDYEDYEIYLPSLENLFFPIDA